MKVILITYNTPSSENIRGASALPYHLMVERGKGINISIYTFNANKLSDDKISEVEQVLNVTINQLPLPIWYIWLFKFHLIFFRVFLKYPLGNYIKLPHKYVDEINDEKPDLIWVYGEELSCVVKQIQNFRRIQIGPDTESLYYYRMMGRRFVMKNAMNYWKCALMYRKYARMEREFPSDENYIYLAVGEEDIRHMHQLNPKVNAKFLRHPHYNVNHKGNDKKFHLPKIKLLIAGRYDLYMQQDADLLVERLIANANLLSSHYSITFLGKGWERHAKMLQDAGWDVNHIIFALDYIEEICKHDIQITPITIGTGTKGKVLDALANGLFVIGTPYAMENIAVEHGISCIEYRNPQEVIDVLQDILMSKEKYEIMARAGQEAVLKYHDRRLLSKELFSL